MNKSVVIKMGIIDVYGVVCGVDLIGGFIFELLDWIEIFKGGEFSLRGVD